MNVFITWQTKSLAMSFWKFKDPESLNPKPWDVLHFSWIKLILMFFFFFKEQLKKKKLNKFDY